MTNKPNQLEQFRPYIPILVFLFAVLMRFIPGVRTIDDSYITYRYARNILAGNGFVYNPGEAVLGTTTPLYTLLMVFLGFFTGGTHAPFPVLAWLVNSLADGFTAILLWQIGKKLNQELAGLSTAIIWCVAQYSITFAIGGLETSLFVLLLTACFYWYLEEKVTFAALLGGLAVLTRPDAIILVFPIALDHLLRIIGGKARLRGKDILALGGIPLLWFGFATFYFGSPIPHSIQAKVGAYHLEATEGLVRLIQHYATPFQQQSWLGTIPAISIGIILYPFLFLVGARALIRTNNRSWVLVIYPWLYFLVFATANPLIFRWYLTPPLPFYFLGILTGTAILIQQIFQSNKMQSKKTLQTWIVALFVFILPFASSLSDWSLHPDHGPNRPAPNMAWFKLELLYREAADLVTPYLDETTVLAAGDVGVLGYYTPGKILDTVGLNSPITLDYYPVNPDFYVTNYAIAPDLIIDQKPDAVILLEVYGRLGLLKDERFLNQYTLYQKLDTDIYGSDGMLIYLRK